MPLLHISQSPGRYFQCNFDGWIESEKERFEWHQITTLVLIFAFLAREVSIITTSPAATSIGHFISNPTRLLAEGHDFLLNYIHSCSKELLVDLGESEDFKRGLLCILSGKPDRDLCLVAPLLHAGSINHDLTVDTELLIMLDDSRTIYWHQPTHNSMALANDIKRMAQDFGWVLRQ